jgi:hypothetical protein
MSFSANFTGARLGDATTTGAGSGAGMLVVDGRSDPATENAEIHVAIPHGGKLLSVTVDASGLTDWKAPFPDVTPPFAAGDEVFVVGVAMRPSPHDPFVWQGSFTVAAPENR